MFFTLFHSIRRIKSWRFQTAVMLVPPLFHFISPCSTPVPPCSAYFHPVGSCSTHSQTCFNLIQFIVAARIIGWLRLISKQQPGLFHPCPTHVPPCSTHVQLVHSCISPCCTPPGKTVADIPRRQVCSTFVLFLFHIFPSGGTGCEWVEQPPTGWKYVEQGGTWGEQPWQPFGNYRSVHQLLIRVCHQATLMKWNRVENICEWVEQLPTGWE